ncbi:MAG: (2Fe-2S)-binding protein [Bacillota bacterium]|nr:(2Fe-2S)-binding protein [Bacillota bacterium]MDW7676815.1 (2Fe-2S)-binding protein [Bacillota bacterium]
MLEKTGVATPEDIESVFPSEERLKKGPVVIVECFREIPCNPCYTACNQNAIKEFVDINDLPNVDHGNCNGCGLCISKCPGLAIRVLDMTWSETEAVVRIPYEFLPLPEAGDVVDGLDREGNAIADARVEKVQNTKAMDKTPVIWLAVKKEFAKEVVFMRPQRPKRDERNDSTIVCRCSDVTLGEIREMVEAGFTTVDEIKRLTRAGMGPCQGKTCGQIILREISTMAGKSMAELSLGTYRPPIKSVKLGEIAETAERGDED